MESLQGTEREHSVSCVFSVLMYLAHGGQQGTCSTPNLNPLPSPSTSQLQPGAVAVSQIGELQVAAVTPSKMGGPWSM